ncbi:hypothetical protein QUF80_22980 [Desulfococcaceae bacterium HSG8]|nr:hypothetical protein [Desulfococcaceae bacterium HSG8]
MQFVVPPLGGITPPKGGTTNFWYVFYWKAPNVFRTFQIPPQKYTTQGEVLFTMSRW